MWHVLHCFHCFIAPNDGNQYQVRAEVPTTMTSRYPDQLSQPFAQAAPSDRRTLTAPRSMELSYRRRSRPQHHKRNSALPDAGSDLPWQTDITH
jgi:hypothetical protein